jgi:hypothetical protein
MVSFACSWAYIELILVKHRINKEVIQGEAEYRFMVASPYTLRSSKTGT